MSGACFCLSRFPNAHAWGAVRSAQRMSTIFCLSLHKTDEPILKQQLKSVIYISWLCCTVNGILTNKMHLIYLPSWYQNSSLALNVPCELPLLCSIHLSYFTAHIVLSFPGCLGIGISFQNFSFCSSSIRSIKGILELWQHSSFYFVLICFGPPRTILNLLLLCIKFRMSSSIHRE